MSLEKKNVSPRAVPGIGTHPARRLYGQKVTVVGVVLAALLSLTSVLSFAQAPAMGREVEKAVESVGGAAALQELKTLTTHASGVRWVLDEGFTPGGEATRIGPYTVQVNYDVENGSLRLDHTREVAGMVRQQAEIVAGELGYLDGHDGRFGEPRQRAMTSNRWASTLQQQRLLNPHLILRDILADPSIVSDAGEVLFDGAVHHRLEIADAVAPLTLFIHAGTGQIAKLATVESMPLRRDVPLEVFYYDWGPAGEDGLSFPSEVYIALDDNIVVKEIRSAITVNPELDSALFDIPAEIDATFNETLATRGLANHQYLQMFAHYGFIRDGVQTNLVAEEVAPGVHHLTGGSHHSLAIEQDGGIVIVETPLSETRSALIKDWVAQNFPDKPISHAVITHHHEDHASGLRDFVAAGAVPVVHEAAADFLAGIFQADSAVVPDTMAADPVQAAREFVPAGGSVTIDDSTNSVEVYELSQTHAEDMVIAYVPEAGIVFVSDLYSPNPNADSAGAGGQIVADTIAALGLDVSLIVGGHGGTIGMEDFEGLLGQ